MNWEITTANPGLTTESFENLLRQDELRSAGQTNGLVNRWRNKLAIIGSKATGNDLTDRGATPLEKNTLLVSKHWNVANSIITGRMIRPVSLQLELGLIVALGVVTALLTWRLRVLAGFLSVLALALGYTILCIQLYTQHRLWLPLVLPLVGAVFVQYGLLVTYRAVFEQREQRRVKSVFAKIVCRRWSTNCSKPGRCRWGRAARSDGDVCRHPGLHRYHRSPAGSDRPANRGGRADRPGGGGAL